MEETPVNKMSKAVRIQAIIVMSVIFLGALFLGLWIANRVLNNSRDVRGQGTLEVVTPQYSKTIQSKSVRFRPEIDDCRMDGCYGLSMYTAYSFIMADGRECFIKQTEEDLRLWQDAKPGDTFDCQAYKESKENKLETKVQ